jgi:hypothetical protein
MDRSERMRRLAEPVESLAQSVARHVIELVVEALDLNALLDQVDLNRVLDQVDVNRLLDKVDVDKLVARVDVRALLTQVDVNELASQVDINALLQRTDVEALLTRSSSSIVSEGILLGRDRRALHDVIAGTAVVYTWDARAARLGFLSRDSLGG